MSNTFNTVDELRKHSASFTNSIDKIDVPTKYKLIYEQQFTYLSDGYEITNYTTANTLILVKNPPYRYGLDRTNFQDSLINLINNDEMKPFLLFINGKFVSWSDIMVYEDYDYTYFAINNIFELNPRIDCVLLPDNVVYNEGYTNVRVVDTTYIGFKADGTIDTSLSAPYVTIDFSNNIFHEAAVINGVYKSSLAYKYRINDDNILTFTDGLYNGDNIITNKGLNVLKSNNSKANYCIIFSNYYQSGDLDNIMQVENKDYLANQIITNSLDDNMRKYLERFDFDYTRAKTYDENISDSIKYIMGYNPNLLNLNYKNISPIKSVYYTGKQLKDLVDSDGFVSISKYFDEGLNNSIMILKNGFLYEKYYMMYLYKNKSYRFPLDASVIKDNDTFEILYFLNTDNSVYDVYIDSTISDNIFTVDPSFDINNAKLFCQDAHNKEFKIRTSKYAQYQIDFKAERISEDKIKFELDDGWYYDKDLSLVSGKEFRYAHISAKQMDGGYKLPLNFVYANDISRYIVFINNRRIDRENFKITDVKPTRPFVNLSIYFNILLKDGDNIDIFYVPMNMEEVLVSPTLGVNNIVAIDRTKIKYGLDENVYMIFLDGKKLRLDQVLSLDANKLILRNVDSKSNISIVKYMKDDELLSLLFSSNDILSGIIDKLSTTQLNLLYNNPTITVKDTGLGRNTMDNSRVLYQIVRDFYMRPFVSLDDAFLYDYYTDSNAVYDSDGNVILNLNN